MSRKSLFKFKSIKLKLSIVLFLITLVSVTSIGIVISSNIRSQIKKDVIKGKLEEVKGGNKSINLFFDSLYNDINMLSENPIIKSVDNNITKYLDKKGTDGKIPMNPGLVGGVETQIYNIYRNYMDNHPYVTDVFLGTNDGGYVQAAKGDTYDNYDPRKRPWYKQGIESGEIPTKTKAYLWEGANCINVSVVRNIKSPSGKTVGVQAMDVRLDSLTKLVDSIKIGETGYIVLTEADGTILSNPKNPSMNFKNSKDLNINIEKLKKGEAITVESKEGKYIAVNYTSKETGWNYILFLKESEIYSGINSINRIIVLISAIMILLSLVVAFISATKITSPILLISDLLNKTASLDLSIDKKYNKLNEYEDELGLISKAVFNLRNEFRSIINELKNGSETILDYSNGLVNEADNASDAINIISHNVEELAQGSTEQAKRAEDGNDKLIGFSDNIDVAIIETRTIKNYSVKTQEVNCKCIESLNFLSDKFNESSISFKEIKDNISELSQRSISIESIVNTIESIAQQTNLLALNAAIEAARAGEAGKGFAVVADEVRKLSEETEQSTREICKFVDEIQSEIGRAKNSVSKGEEIQNEVEDAVKNAEVDFKTIHGVLIEMMMKLDALILEINSVGEEKEGVIFHINEISTIAQESAASIEEVSANVIIQSNVINSLSKTAESLKGVVDNMELIVSRFKL
ncbi:methyl-accepting chemotaxis protein [Clostridium cylindrosporum]|uniref:Methyl-accepting chemotaxis protein McpC n=1 Tax=Clostridium cylindrosporum DSM 605 TaxID=1121307 RepID=A0A0J8DG61_CLOCY|nr:methyl-accepting chemotaxis protein [Clostridium cylindrosporum]KMT23158.1 methyl-accepting chemotaxis protein McpC [Clostridium cylindrosporum DSM 605]